MKNSCESCDAICCKYVVVEIDTPETIKEFENIKWFVCHKNIEVFVDDEGIWNIRHITPCDYLDSNNKCTIYSTRPEVCQEFSSDYCPKYEEYEEVLTFKTIEDVEKYVENVFLKGKHSLQ